MPATRFTSVRSFITVSGRASDAGATKHIPRHPSKPRSFAIHHGAIAVTMGTSTQMRPRVTS